MTPDMQSSVGGLAIFAVLAWLACAWVFAGGLRRVLARRANRAGRKR